MKNRGLLVMSKSFITVILLCAVFLDIAGTAMLTGLLLHPNQAEAATKVIEHSPSVTAAIHTVTGSNSVFIDDQIGYKFHVYGAAPFSGMCVYRKTTDGGLTWSYPVPVDTQTDCSGLAVWYDKWTPGDTGTAIHIAYL